MPPNSEPTAPELRWMVCHTKPRCEKKFAALLEAGAIEHYLPLMENVRNYGAGGKKISLKPLFSGYVFARVPAGNRNLIYQQKLLVRTLPVDNESLLLRQLDQVRTLLASGLTFTLKPLFSQGRAVRVSSGPLWGIEGVVHSLADTNEVIVKVDVLQQGLLVKIPLAELEVLP